MEEDIDIPYRDSQAFDTSKDAWDSSFLEESKAYTLESLCLCLYLRDMDLEEEEVERANCYQQLVFAGRLEADEQSDDVSSKDLGNSMADGRSTSYCNRSLYREIFWPFNCSDHALHFDGNRMSDSFGSS